MKRIAVTGGIAEGKSTVLARLASEGYSTVSADDVVRNLMSEPDIRGELLRIVGLTALAVPQEIRQAIAADNDVRRRVNRFLHPLVTARLIASPAQFHEVPLLYEICVQGLYESVWLVTCGKEEQRRRLVARYGDTPEVDRLLSTQLSSVVKKAHVDFEIRTVLPIESVYHQLEIALGCFGLKR